MSGESIGEGTPVTLRGSPARSGAGSTRDSSSARTPTPTPTPTLTAATATASATASSFQNVLGLETFGSPDGLNGEDIVDIEASSPTPLRPLASTDVTPVTNNFNVREHHNLSPPSPSMSSPPPESIQSDQQRLLSPPVLDSTSVHSDFVDEPSQPLQPGLGHHVGGSALRGRNRPPLAPNPNFRGHPSALPHAGASQHAGTSIKQVQVHHRRATSLGDQSYLSMLTESSMELGESDRSDDRRRRTVSWEFDYENSPAAMKPSVHDVPGTSLGASNPISLRALPNSILQPILSDNFTGAKAAVEQQRGVTMPGPSAAAASRTAVTPAEPLSAGQRQLNPGHAGEGAAEGVGHTGNVGVGSQTARQVLQRGPRSLKGVVTLADITQSPLEEEAETCILEALERREQEKEGQSMVNQGASAMRSSLSSTSTPIMAGLPDSAVAMFADDDTGWRPMMDTLGQSPNLGRDPSSEESEEGYNRSEGDKINCGPESEDQDKGSSKNMSPSTITTPNRPPNSRIGVEKGRSKTNARQRASATPRYDNMMVGLTEQLRAMQMGRVSIRAMADGSSRTDGRLNNGESNKYFLCDGAEEGNQDLQGISKADEAHSHAPPMNATDALVKDANLLFRRTKGAKERSDKGADGIDIEAHNNKEEPGNKRQVKSKWTALRSAVGVKVPPKEKDDNDGDNLVAADGDNNDSIKDRPSKSGIKKEEDQHSVSLCEHSARRKKQSTFHVKAKRSVRRWFALLQEELEPRKQTTWKKMSYLFFGMILPSLLLSAILFYAAENPMTCKAEYCASLSWWLIFVGIRQALTFHASKILEIFVVDLFSLRTRVSLRLWGPFITLWIVQSKGWPFQATFWAVIDFVVLYGDHAFPKHWLFYQDAIKMCNANNPSGTVTHSEGYLRILLAAIVAGVLTALKRLWLSTYLGTRSCDHFGPQVQSIMREMLLIGEVANLSQEIEELSKGKLSSGELTGRKNLYNWDLSAYSSEVDEVNETPTSSPLPQNNAPLDLQRERTNVESRSKGAEGGNTSKTESPMSLPQAESFALGQTTRLKLYQLLGEWEEPEVKDATLRSGTPASVQDVLKFRQAVSMLDNRYPFSVAFGKASTREACIDSAQSVYSRLLLLTPGVETLPFETLSLVALDRNGEVESNKMKALIRLFRPDRNGKLTPIDFVKSIDSVYKRFRLLRANLKNSSQIDRAYERLVNTAYYFFLAVVCLAILNLNPWPFIASLTGVLVSFAFCFGTAASKYFEGLLLIFVRRPYDIGDRIAVSQVDQDTNPNGSSTWFVEGVDLFTTTVRSAVTNEVATYSNGSLASSRIINAARSPKAQVYVYLKFSLDVPYEKIVIFKETIEKFVKARPREWMQMSAFRATLVEAELGYVEYSIVLIHRERWQNIAVVLNSKADLSSFSVEVQKKLDMRYFAPPMPIHLDAESRSESINVDQAAQGREGMGGDASTALNDVTSSSMLSDFFGQQPGPVMERKKTS